MIKQGWQHLLSVQHHFLQLCLWYICIIFSLSTFGANLVLFVSTLAYQDMDFKAIIYCIMRASLAHI